MKTWSLTVCECGYTANHLLSHTAKRRVHGSAVKWRSRYTVDGSLNRKLKPNHAQGSSEDMFEEDMTRRGGPSAGQSCGAARAARHVASLPRMAESISRLLLAVLHFYGVVETRSTSNQAGNAGAAAAGCVKKDVPRARSVSGQTLTRLVPWTKYVSELPRERLVCTREPSEIA